MSPFLAPAVDPYAYLCDVLRRIADFPLQRSAELLPNNWEPAESRDRSPLQYRPGRHQDGFTGWVRKVNEAG